MASSSVSLSPQFLSTSTRTLSRFTNSHHHIVHLQFQFNRTPSPRLQASRRVPIVPLKGDNLVDDPRNWKRNRSGIVFGDYNDDVDEDEDDEEEEEEDRSLDLLIKFVQNVYRKISRKARKAVRSVLPLNISTKLVGFSVDGVIILAFLWVMKAFLEVVCTLGSVVFVSILLIRGIWTGLSYLQDTRNRRTDELDDAWTGTQPV